MPELTRTIQITLPHDVAHLVEVRAAMDNLRLSEGIEQMLCIAVEGFRERREVSGNA